MAFVYACPLGMPRSFQTSGRSSFLMPSRSMRWPPVNFTMGTLYFTATCAMRISSSAVVTPRVDARHHRERAVLLDVRVDAIVDETGVALVVVLVGPQRFQQRRQADLAGGIFRAARQLREDRTDRLEAAALDLGDELRFFERHAGNVVVLGRVVAHFAETRLPAAAPPDSCTNRSPGPPWCMAPTFETLWQPMGLNRVDDLPLADAVAVADLRVVGKVRRLKQRHAGRRSEEEVGAARRHFGARHEHLHQCAGGFDLAEQNRSGDLAVADDHLLVDAFARARDRRRLRRSASAALVSPIDASSTPITFSLVPSFEPRYAALGLRSRDHVRQHVRHVPRSDRPGRRSCRDARRIRQARRSPGRWCASGRRRRSPLSTVRPDAVAISVMGRMPALTTTMSVSSVEPSLNSRWVMRPSAADDPGGDGVAQHLMPMPLDGLRGACRRIRDRAAPSSVAAPLPAR